MAKCLVKDCGDAIQKRQVICGPCWKDVNAVRKEAIRKVYGRGPEQLKFIDMLINGDLKTVQKIVNDKDVCVEAFKNARARVDLADKPAEEVKVVYKVKV